MDATPESDAADVGFDGGQSQDHTRAFCPADSMHEVRGCEARLQCREKRARHEPCSQNEQDQIMDEPAAVD